MCFAKEMPLENPQSKEVTPAKSPTKETMDLLDQSKTKLKNIEKETLQSTIEKTMMGDFLLMNQKDRASELVDYLLNGNYKSRKNLEMEQLLDQISFSNLSLNQLFTQYINPLYKNKVTPTTQPSTATVTNKEWVFDSVAKAINAIATSTKETLSDLWSKITDTANNMKTGIEHFFDTVSKLVNIDGVPPNQIPILKATIEGGQKLFNKLYEYGWGWIGKTIDCSHLVSFALRAGGILMPNQYLTSTALYQKFSKHKIAKQGVRAGDLMFWGTGWWGHVEITVGKPYRKNGELYIRTLWSSSDTTKVSPMYNIDGTPARKINWVAYRERKIEDRHQFLRPYYDIISNQSKKQSLPRK